MTVHENLGAEHLPADERQRGVLYGVTDSEAGTIHGNVNAGSKPALKRWNSGHFEKLGRKI
jgi:hypothetical protein